MVTSCTNLIKGSRVTLNTRTIQSSLFLFLANFEFPFGNNAIESSCLVYGAILSTVFFLPYFSFNLCERAFFFLFVFFFSLFHGVDLAVTSRFPFVSVMT